MTSNIDELIEFCTKEHNMIAKSRQYHHWDNPIKGKKEDDVQELKRTYELVYKIALATLQAHKDGFVMCPSEPTDEMVDCFYTAFKRQTLGQYAYKGIIAGIQARPTTPLDEILRGVE